MSVAIIRRQRGYVVAWRRSLISISGTVFPHVPVYSGKKCQYAWKYFVEQVIQPNGFFCCMHKSNVFDFCDGEAYNILSFLWPGDSSTNGEYICCNRVLVWVWHSISIAISYKVWRAISAKCQSIILQTMDVLKEFCQCGYCIDDSGLVSTEACMSVPSASLYGLFFISSFCCSVIVHLSQIFPFKAFVTDSYCHIIVTSMLHHIYILSYYRVQG